MKPSMSLHHGAISVRDMDQSIAWYEDVFDFKVDTVTNVSDDFRISHLKLGRSYIELFWKRGHQEIPKFATELDSDLDVLGTKHIAFETDDAESMREYLNSKRVELICEIGLDNCDLPRSSGHPRSLGRRISPVTLAHPRSETKLLIQ